MVNKILIWILGSILLFSCNEKKTSKKEANLYNKGEITLQYDDAYVNIADALSYRYEQAYPETKIKLSVNKEDKALENLLNRKVDLVIMSRDLTEKERKYWDINMQIPWQPSFFAADAVCFVVNKNNPKEFITLEEIKELILSEEKRLIIDGKNTSNFNAIIQKLNIDESKTYFSPIKGNNNIIKNLDKYPNHIGVISYNTINTPNREDESKKNMKILPIKVNSSLILPSKKTLKSQEYPLTKLLYFITREEKFGLANGFIRYSCTSIGQKIVSKEGLQPYFLFPRTVKINTQK